MEGDNLFKQVPTGWLPLLPAIEKILKCWLAKKSYCQCEQEECPSQIWKYVEVEGGGKEQHRVDICKLIVQSPLVIFEEAKRSYEGWAGANGPELFNVMDRLRYKLRQQRNDLFLGNKTVLELKTNLAARLNKDFLNFLTKIVIYLEFDFNFTSSDCFCSP
jgi:hypothetical protein